MQSLSDIRPGEEAVAPPAAADAGLVFIGVIRTPWTTRGACPRRGDLDGPVCRIEVFEPWRRALAGLEARTHLQILYWMHEARRDLVVQKPNHTGKASGTFALRSPNRPNPIASSLVRLVAVHPDGLSVQGLDCLDGTPLIDVKPEVCPHDGGRPAAAG
ncbi:MAG TPA: tRNA (N6-threonylcarbamoyladenosine(37)-N6)-methyltransferase TrmO [Beijerinckiaceae bacterium]